MVKGKIKSNTGFWIGDICYILNEEFYDEDWGNKHDYQNGIFTDGNGIGYAVAGTAYGDGYYVGSDEFLYPVDAGVIGIVSQEIAYPHYPEGCRYINHSGEMNFESEDGFFKIITPNGEVVTIETDEEDW